MVVNHASLEASGEIVHCRRKDLWLKVMDREEELKKWTA